MAEKSWNMASPTLDCRSADQSWLSIFGETSAQLIKKSKHLLIHNKIWLLIRTLSLKFVYKSKL